MKCKCQLCKRAVRFRWQLRALTPKQREYFEALYETLCMAELDLEVHQAVIAGKWPSADEWMKGKWVRATAVSVGDDAPITREPDEQNSSSE